MTNHWVDIKNADVILVMGGNAAEAHPCGFKWVTEAKAHRKARLIVVDPRFTRTASVADYYAPIRTGTDIAFLGGIINYLLTNDKIQHEYVRNYTDFSFIVREDFSFTDGLFSGYNPEKHSYDKSSWDYEKGDDGYVKTDPTLSHPRSVYQLMKAHYSRYTPEMVEKICGTPKEKFLHVCEVLASTAATNRAGTILYALGWTHHSVGSQMIRTGAMVQLLLGNIGIAGGGMNALRGHSNIQGLTDLGLLSNQLPGYMTLPVEAEQDYEAYITARALKPLRPNQLSYYQNYRAFYVSFMKSWWGDAATKENNWGYDYLPKVDKLYDLLQAVELMHQGKMTGYICQGFNVIASAPNKAKVVDGLGKLKWLVVMDPLATETSEFWKNYGEYNDVDPSQIQTEVFRLPTTCFAEEDGAIVSSSRVLQWHWKGAQPPGEARSDLEIMSGIFTRMRDMYRKEGGKFSDPIVNLTWKYADPESPRPDELAREYNGRALADLPDPANPGHALVKAGQQLAGFAQLRDDGSTACGCWIFCGCLDGTGQPDGPPRQQRPDRHRPDAQLGVGVAGEPARAVQPRFVRCGRQAVRSEPQADRVGRQPLDGDGHPRLQGRRSAGAWHGSVHHESGRRRTLFRARRDERGAVPRALRAIRDADRIQPVASAPPERDEQPGGTRVPRRSRAVRQGRPVPARGNHVPPHGAFPLLDQARAPERNRAAATVRGNRRGPRERGRRRGGRPREGVEQSRTHRRRGSRHQTDQAAHDRRPQGPRRSAFRCTGASRAKQSRVTWRTP